MSSYILLENMRFFARHGVFEEERRIGGHFTVDLKIKIDVEVAMQSDDVADTVNYAEVYDLVAKEMLQPSRLLEHLAGRIMKSIQNQYPNIQSLEIKVSKLNPPLEGEVDKASVVLIHNPE